MRKEKELIILLRGLVELLARESERNPEFAHKLEFLLSELPEKKSDQKRRRRDRRQSNYQISMQNGIRVATQNSAFG